MSQVQMRRPGTRTTTRPRVLFAIAGLGPGGSEQQLVELLVRIHPSEVDATLVTFESASGSPRLRKLLDAGVRHEALGVPRTPAGYARAMARVASVFRSVRPDVAYPWLEQAAVLVAPIARAWGVPIVIGRRNLSGPAIERSFVAALAIRRIERLATVVTGNSNAVVDAAIRRGIPRSQLRLVFNGHPDLPPLELPRGVPVVLGYVARFRPEKGHLRFLEALKLLDRDVAWRVDLAGDGRLMKSVHEKAERLGLESKIRFVGLIDDLRAFWSERAIAVLLSDHEGLPNALIEAAFCGRPLVGTNVGGIPEVVAPSGGFLVPPDDPDAIAEVLANLIRSEQLRRDLGEGAYAQAQRRFGMAAFVAGHLSAINGALAERRPTGAGRAGAEAAKT